MTKIFTSYRKLYHSVLFWWAICDQMQNQCTAHAQTLLSCLKYMAMDRLRVRLNVVWF